MAEVMQPPTNGAPGVNRKKAKRRAKEAAKKAAQQQEKQNNGHFRNGQVSQGTVQYDEAEYQDPADQYEAGDGDYSDGAPIYEDTNGHFAHHQYVASQAVGKSRKKGKKGSAAQNGNSHLVHSSSHIHHPPPPSVSPLSNQQIRNSHRSNNRDRIWNTSTQEERERIKEFWLSLGEDERKSLVKIEKEAVLRKMKEQQKHSCSCTVCGRKRTAIEEELEVLYDAYYEELEQYAYHWHEYKDAASCLFLEDPCSRLGRLPPDRMPPLMNPHQHTSSRLRDLADDDGLEDEDDLEDYGSDELDDADGDYSDDDEDEDDEDDDEPLELPRGPAADFFNFGNSLTVKGKSTRILGEDESMADDDD